MWLLCATELFDFFREIKIDEMFTISMVFKLDTKFVPLRCANPSLGELYSLQQTEAGGHTGRASSLR